jgi:hypothetical protein
MVQQKEIEMNVRELREYLADFPDSAKVEIVVENYPKEYSLGWGCADGANKATAFSVSFMVGGSHESA